MKALPGRMLPDIILGGYPGKSLRRPPFQPPPSAWVHWPAAGTSPHQSPRSRPSGLLGSVQFTQSELVPGCQGSGRAKPILLSSLGSGLREPAWHGRPWLTGRPCRAGIPPLALPRVHSFTLQCWRAPPRIE